MRDRFFSWLLSGLSWLIARLSEGALERLSRGIGVLLERLDRRRGKDARANLDFAYGESLSEEEKQRIITRGYRNLAYNALDFLRLGAMEESEIMARLAFEGEEYLQQALASGRPVVVITAHYGSWELGSLSLGRILPSFVVVGRALKNRALDGLVARTRERFGIRLVEKKGAMRELVRAMKSGASVGIVVDQNTSEKEGILVDFFGKRVRHTPSASILARRFEAYILPVFATSSEDYRTHTIHFKAPFLVEKSEDVERDILEATQRQATITEMMIRQKPDDWFWFHQRFKNQYEEIYRYE